MGMCVIDSTVGRVPAGLKDSKLLIEKRRVELAPIARSWALHSSVGLASNEEIDSLGLTAALGLAGLRAALGLREQGVQLLGSVVILDGKFDWLTPALGRHAHGPQELGVVTRIKADLDCASVSAASVLAKVHRDDIMIQRSDDHPPYGWRANKGYGSRSHYAAISEFGATDFHRHTWLKDPAKPAEAEQLAG